MLFHTKKRFLSSFILVALFFLNTSCQQGKVIKNNQKVISMPQLDLRKIPDDIKIQIVISKSVVDDTMGGKIRYLDIIGGQDTLSEVKLIKEKTLIAPNLYVIELNGEPIEKLGISLHREDQIRIRMKEYIQDKIPADTEYYSAPGYTSDTESGLLEITGLRQENTIKLRNKKGETIFTSHSYPVLSEWIKFGKYKLEVHHPMYKKIERKIKIKTDGEVKIELKGMDWKLKLKSIQILGIPYSKKSVYVMIDKKKYGRDHAIAGIELYYGDHTFKIEHPDYSYSERHITVDEDTNKIMVRTDEFEKKKGMLSIRSLKKDSKIFVQDKYGRPPSQFKTFYEVSQAKPELNVKIDVGVYNITIVHPIYETISEKNILISEEAPSDIDLKDKWDIKNGKINILLPPLTPQRTTIWIDDEKFEYNDFANKPISIPFGSHTLKIDHPSYEPFEDFFEINRKDIILNRPTGGWSRKKGTLTVDARKLPSNVRFEIDGKAYNLSNLIKGQQLTAGDHVLVITHQRYKTKEIPITLQWKSEKHLTLNKMTPKIGTIVIDHLKEDSKVFVSVAGKNPINRTAEFLDGRLNLIVDRYNVVITHWQHHDLKHPVLLNNAGDIIHIASLEDWKNNEKKGSIIFDVIKPNSQVFIDGDKVNNPRPGVLYKKIVGEHSYRMKHPVYHELSDKINLHTEDEIHVSKENEWLLQYIDINTEGFSKKVAFFDGKSARLVDGKLRLELRKDQFEKGKKFYVLLMQKNRGKDPIDDFRCFVLPLGYHASLVRQPGFTLNADSRSLTVESIGNFTGDKIFLYNASGDNLKAFNNLPIKNFPLQKGKYTLEWGRNKRDIELPYNAYYLLTNNSVKQKVDLSDPLVAFHFYRQEDNINEMKKAWFNFCKAEHVKIFKGKPKEVDLKKMISYWNRYRFEGKLKEMASEYIEEINRIFR